MLIFRITALFENPFARVPLALLEQGVLVSSIGDHVLRFVPPLIIISEEIDSFIPMLESGLCK
ncbi:MAG: hypothetical protein ACI3U1_00730 [Peptococcaceae bacterium]